MDPARDEIVVLAAVVGAHGVRGRLRIRPYTVNTQSLLDYPTWWLKPARGEWRAFRPLGGRVHGGELVAGVEGVATREAALALKGFEVGVPRGALPPVPPGEVYWLDLVGLDVVNREGVALGTVSGVSEHGAHPLLRVARPGGAGGDERLIPCVPAIVERVDLAARRSDVDWKAD